MVISTPREIESLVRQIPYGSVLTIDELRRQIAEKHSADIACPLTTGIFLRIVSEAADALRANGGSDVAPYWRVVRRGGELHDKYPGGPERQAALLELEGISIERRRGKLFVAAEHLGL